MRSIKPDGHDLGFTWRVRKNGEIELLHHGRLASTLRGRDAAEFRARIDLDAPAELQQRAARLTGNYRRGNERLAGSHPRRGG